MRGMGALVSAVMLLLFGCATRESVIQQPVREVTEEEKSIELAPGERELLLEKAKSYAQHRDYANALINIVRAERAEGDDSLQKDISAFRNELIENLNAQAIIEKTSVDVGKGLDAPLKYMVFYTEGEVIYPAFNIPVRFDVKKGRAQITKNRFTNTDGVAECEVAKVEALEENELTVTAGVHIEIEGETFTIAKLKRDFTLHHRSIRDQAISFVMFERNIDEVAPSSASGKQIERFFIENGYSVKQGMYEGNGESFLRAFNGDIEALNEYKSKLDSRLIAFTYIESMFSSKVTEGFYFAKSNISLFIIDASTDEVVFSSVLKDVKGAGNTREKAGRNAISEATEEFIQKVKREISETEVPSQ